MDNGHTSQSGGASAQPFFTAGAGTNSVDINNSDIKDNLNINNKESSWNNTSPDRDPRNIGNLAINPQEVSNQDGIINEALPQETNPHPEQNNTSPELGKVINLEMPPGMNKGDSTKIPDQSEIIEASFDRNVIKTTKSGLEAAAIKEADKVANKKLYKDDDAAGYYDIMRDMAHTNTNNSYGDRSAWKEAA